MSVTLAEEAAGPGRRSASSAERAAPPPSHGTAPSSLSGMVQAHGSPLEHLELYGNRISLLREAEYLRGLDHLSTLVLKRHTQGNPVCEEATYRTRFASLLPQLRTLDGLPTTDQRDQRLQLPFPRNSEPEAGHADWQAWPARAGAARPASAPQPYPSHQPTARAPQPFAPLPPAAPPQRVARGAQAQQTEHTHEASGDPRRHLSTPHIDALSARRGMGRAAHGPRAATSGAGTSAAGGAWTDIAADVIGSTSDVFDTSALAAATSVGPSAGASGGVSAGDVLSALSCELRLERLETTLGLQAVEAMMQRRREAEDRGGRCWTEKRHSASDGAAGAVRPRCSSSGMASDPGNHGKPQHADGDREREVLSDVDERGEGSGDDEQRDSGNDNGRCSTSALEPTIARATRRNAQTIGRRKSEVEIAATDAKGRAGEGDRADRSQTRRSERAQEDLSLIHI